MQYWAAKPRDHQKVLAFLQSTNVQPTFIFQEDPSDKKVLSVVGVNFVLAAGLKAGDTKTTWELV